MQAVRSTISSILVRGATPVAAAIITVMWLCLIIFVPHVVPLRTEAAGGGMGYMSLDMDPHTTPANTATSLGSIENCARINENDQLDADEDSAADTIDVDATATGIPASAPMQGFSFQLGYDEANLTIQSAVASTGTGSGSYLLNSLPGSNLFPVDEPTPDTDGNGIWTASQLDVGPDGTEETGSGVLERLTISSDTGASAGLYAVAFSRTDSVHLTSDQKGHVPNSFADGKIAIDTACPAPATVTPTASPGSPTPTSATTSTTSPTNTPVNTLTPTPSPSTSGTPTPTATTTPAATATPPGHGLLGDVDCDSDVDSVDALLVLRDAAGLPHQGGCAAAGDVDCDGDEDTVDALFILRHVAALPTSLPQGCGPIGV